MASIYSVSQVNSYIKNMFVQDFALSRISVRGEVSNCKYHSLGHIYFTLKDAKGVITCVMFAGSRAGLSFQMQEGQMVVVGGTIDVYERDGKYQLYAKQIVLDGAGRLYEKFEQLKQELAEMGMFAPEYKQPIPKYIQKLGVVTARRQWRQLWELMWMISPLKRLLPRNSGLRVAKKVFQPMPQY